jgi:hypothetical protein
MQRRAADASAPPPVRGAAFGFMWSLAGGVDEQAAAHAVRSAGRAETLGDFLAGVFALAREEVLRTPGLLGVVDGLIAPMTRDEFLIAIPSLRMAFAWFPPREREEIARQILGLHGGEVTDARKFVKLAVSAEVALVGMRLDGEVDALAARYGLGDGLDANDAKDIGQEGAS